MSEPIKRKWTTIGTVGVDDHAFGHGLAPEGGEHRERHPVSRCPLVAVRPLPGLFSPSLSWHNASHEDMNQVASTTQDAHVHNPETVNPKGASR